jgi:lambda repressor-like predicted transcriptional regulator
MHRVVLIVLAVASLAVGGTALAAGSPGAKERPRAAKVAAGGLLKVAADYLGVTPKALRAELRQGRSLAQVATAREKSVDGLEQALLTAYRARVQAARTAGKIDAARAQRMLDRAPARIERLVEATRAGKARRAKVRLAKGLLAVAADYLDVTRKQLVAELRQGRSLAQVATVRGKSVDGLETVLLDAFKAKVNAAVAAGKLDATRAQRMLERAPARIERLVTRARG